MKALLTALVLGLAIYAPVHAETPDPEDEEVYIPDPNEPEHPQARPVYRPFKPDRLQPGRIPEPGESVGK